MQNSIWSDMMVETTCMKIGKVPGEIIGVTTQPQTLKVWAKSQHIQIKLVLSDLECLRNKDESSKQVHKEETKARITSDNKNIKKVENFTKTCIHPLDLESHRENSLCNVDTGEETAADVNVNKAFESGHSQLKSLPEGFISTTKNIL